MQMIIFTIWRTSLMLSIKNDYLKSRKNVGCEFSIRQVFTLKNHLSLNLSER